MKKRRVKPSKPQTTKQWMQSLKWDRRPRLATFFTRYFGSEYTEYNRRQGPNLFVSMVDRAFNPGCACDHMVLLTGPQGLGKSEALRVIGGNWYTQTTFVTPSDLDGFKGKLVVEIAEAEIHDAASYENFKRFFSARADRYRPPYHKKTVIVARQFVFVGTTSSRDYLEETGRPGRRIFPVRVYSAQLEALKRDREQLFAEAVNLHKINWGWVL